MQEEPVEYWWTHCGDGIGLIESKFIGWRLLLYEALAAEKQ